MSIKVVTPPQPFLTPADIAGSHAADAPGIALIIAAAVEEIDGYTGWLGRCLAPQLLEWRGWSGRSEIDMPVGPVIEIESVSTEDLAGTTTVVPTGQYRFDNGLLCPALGAAWIRQPLFRVRYWAGYGRRNPDDANRFIETVPARAKQAVILSVQHMIAVGAENLFLRSEQVEGVGTTSYTVSDQASAIVAAAAEQLLSGLKVYRV